MHGGRISGRIRRDVGMETTDFLVGRVLIEVAHRIPAEKRKSVALGELIPQGLQANRSDRMPRLPQHVYHLAVRADHAVLAAAAGPFDQRRDRISESRGVGHPVDHKLGEGCFSIDHDEIAGSFESPDIEVARRQHAFDRLKVRRRGDDDRRQARHEAFSKKLTDHSGERLPALVEPNGVELTVF